jgi:HK97 family phage major capsid protein
LNTAFDPAYLFNAIKIIFMENDLELIEGLVEDFGTFKTKQSATVQEIQDELAAKGSTLKQIMEKLQQMEAKGGHKFIALPGGEQSTHEILKEAFTKEFPAIQQKSKSEFERHKFTTKDVGIMTAANNLTGSVVASYANQPAVRPRRKLHFRDLVSVIPSSTGVWKFYRSNTPTGEGSFDTQSTHGAAKSQIDYDLTEITVTTEYLAGYCRIAKQMMQDLPFLTNFVTSEMVEDYLRSEDVKFFGQLYSAATGTAGSSTVTAEKIIQTIANLRENDYDPNGIVTTHAVWAKLLNTKPADYSIPGGVTITADGQIAIAGIPVFPTVESNIGANRMLIGDWTQANIIQTEGLSVNLYEQDADNVTKNLITARAEARVALATRRANGFCWATAGTT